MDNKDITEHRESCVIINYEIAKLNVIGIDLASGEDMTGGLSINE